MPPKRTAVGITLLAWLSLLLASLIWGFSLLDSLDRPSVGNALEQRQLELNLLAIQGKQSPIIEKLVEKNPTQLLLEAVQKSSTASSSESLLEQGLLELQLGKSTAAKLHFESVASNGSPQQQSLAKALLRPEASEQLPPLPERPIYRLLSCKALAKPTNLCVAPPLIEQAKTRLMLVSLLPLAGVLAGVLAGAQGHLRGGA